MILHHTRLRAYAGSVIPVKKPLELSGFSLTQARMLSYSKSESLPYSCEYTVLIMCTIQRTHMTYSAQDNLTLGLIGYLIDESDESRSVASILRTNATAISIFRSLFDMDPMDALEDYLSRKRGHCVADISDLLASLEDTRCNSTSRLSVFSSFGYCPLEYAIRYLPQSVPTLLEDKEGPGPGAFAVILCAVNAGRHDLVKPLLDAGGDVNMKGWLEYTALLDVCSRCYYLGFLELLKWAESDIDWDIRTPDGHDALDVFETAVSTGWATYLPQSAVDHFRQVLVEHMILADDCSGALDMPGGLTV